MDKIQNSVLKNIGREAIQLQLMYIVNAILKLSHYSDQWKISIIHPILKPGKKPKEPSSYRPISLLTTMSKVTKKIIHRRMNIHENKNKIMAEHQFGFRNGHNTVQLVTRIVNDISTHFNKKLATAMLLLDIEKAFDRVWIDGLIYKLIQL